MNNIPPTIVVCVLCFCIVVHPFVDALTGKWTFHCRGRVQTFIPSRYHHSTIFRFVPNYSVLVVNAAGTSNNDNNNNDYSPVIQQAPSQASVSPVAVLNGKRVLPFQIISSGLQGQAIHAVYAIMNAQYKRGTEGWESCEYVDITSDLDSALKLLRERFGGSKVAHVRALSFAFPQEQAMQTVAKEWRTNVVQAGGTIEIWKLGNNDDSDVVNRAVEAALEAEEEEDDDDDDDWTMDLTAQAMSVARTSSHEESTVVSPFAGAAASAIPGSNNIIAEPDAVTNANLGELEFSQENVNQVLEEVRPYLIADGGNVSVERVDPNTRNVYLKLQGACGSCPSSTVTMQMGIERVLKEKFSNLGQVLQVQDGSDAVGDSNATELTWDAVQKEVTRILPAITALGGVVQLVKVDPTFGVVDVKFRGSNRIRQGLEMAIRDVPLVKHVNFVMGDD